MVCGRPDIRHDDDEAGSLAPRIRHGQAVADAARRRVPASIARHRVFALPLWVRRDRRRFRNAELDVWNDDDIQRWSSRVGVAANAPVSTVRSPTRGGGLSRTSLRREPVAASAPEFAARFRFVRRRFFARSPPRMVG